MGAVILLGSAGCDDRGRPSEPVTRQTPIVPLDSGIVTIHAASGATRLNVEIATSAEQQSIGLMDRDYLPADQGMLFLNSSPQHGAFFMYRTRIPLDVAFFDDEGRITSIQQMHPCTSPRPEFCTRYVPDAPYLGALEANIGYFARHGIEPGATVVVEEAVRGMEAREPPPR